MDTLRLGIHFDLQTLVVMKFWTEFLITIYIFLAMTLLRELVVSPESIVFLTSPSVVNEGI